jgi:serine/threonine-protein kinase RsbW
MYGEWSMRSELGQERRILALLAGYLNGFAPLSHRLDDMATVVAEACLNAAEHGNGLDLNKQVRIRLQVDRERAVCRVLDEGSGFDYEGWIAAKADMPRAEDKLEEDNPRGWGLFLIRSLSDRVRFGYEAGTFYTEVEFVSKWEG